MSRAQNHEAGRDTILLDTQALGPEDCAQGVGGSELLPHMLQPGLCCV